MTPATCRGRGAGLSANTTCHVSNNAKCKPPAGSIFCCVKTQNTHNHHVIELSIHSPAFYFYSSNFQSIHSQQVGASCVAVCFASHKSAKTTTRPPSLVCLVCVWMVCLTALRREEDSGRRTRTRTSAHPPLSRRDKKSPTTKK